MTLAKLPVSFQRATVNGPIEPSLERGLLEPRLNCGSVLFCRIEEARCHFCEFSVLPF
jgi:hypothetical protein